jgi:hypothetical protein
VSITCGRPPVVCRDASRARPCRDLVRQPLSGDGFKRPIYALGVVQPQELSGDADGTAIDDLGRPARRRAQGVEPKPPGRDGDLALFLGIQAGPAALPRAILTRRIAGPN